MLSDRLIDRLLPEVNLTPADWERDFPLRPLPEAAEVTRFAPSPTGYVHIGSILVALIAESVARQTGGVFILRIEDTDRSRFVEDAVPQLLRALDYFRITPDEGVSSQGKYGPYQQSERQRIYDSYTAFLLSQGRAYPCFCSPTELEQITEAQRAAGAPPGYWGEWARCRNLAEHDVLRHLEEQRSYVIRFRAPAFAGKRIRYTDVVRGELEIDDNRNDVVIRKTMGLPTYHLAHAVDDHLMRVTTVIRADEWLSSVPLHLQLFEALGFPLPTYAHIAPLVKQDGKSRRKLSKRKDPEANVDYYGRLGYPVEGILTYLRGLANARIADQPYRLALAQPINLRECASSGQLLDLAKIEHICREVIADLAPPEVIDRLAVWAETHDPELAAAIAADRQCFAKALTIEQATTGGVRKNLAKWSDFRQNYGFLIPPLFEPVREPGDSRFAPVAPDAVVAMAQRVETDYQSVDTHEEWLAQIRAAALALGFAATAADYKRNPQQYRGSIRDAANIVRVLLTGSTRGPDLFDVSRILGEVEVRRRLRSVLP